MEIKYSKNILIDKQKGDSAFANEGKYLNSSVLNKKKLPLSNLFFQKLLIRLTNRRILLPFYHAVSDERLPHVSNLYSVRKIELFINDLNFFCKYYKPISINELYEIVLENRKITKPVFHLTFDDGLKQVYTDIAPILEQKGIPATFFVNTSFIDNKDLFYRYKISLIIEHIKNNNIETLSAYLSHILSKKVINKQAIYSELYKLDFNCQKMIDEIAVKLGINFNDFLQNYQPYLNSSEIKTLMKKGFSFGSHSLDHPHFKNLSANEQQRQIAESFFMLSSQFELNNKYFSFPFSDENIKISLFNWLYEYEQCQLSFGISGLKNDVNRFHLHRIPMENTTSSAEEIIKKEYLYYLLKLFLNKNTIKRDA